MKLMKNEVLCFESRVLRVETKERGRHTTLDIKVFLVFTIC